MNDWRTHISLGNQYFNRRKFKVAEVKYMDALYAARSCLNESHDPFYAITGLVISYTNLADSFMKQLEIDTAGNYLLEAYRVVNKLIANTESSPSWNRACKRGLIEIKLSLKKFLTVFPDAKICEDCYRKIFSEATFHNTSSIVH